ncbi:hypothetical protein [Arenimonas alkanexedens]
MRFGLVGLVLGTVLVAGCGEAEVAPPASDSAEVMRQAVARAAERKASSPATAPKGATLKTALPGDVMPEFDYAVGSDFSSKVRNTQRIVMLRARGISAQDALTSLAGQFTAAGLESGDAGANEATLLQGFWTPGEGRGLMVVDAGGTHVQVMARDFEASSESAGEGYSALVTVTVNSP